MLFDSTLRMYLRSFWGGENSGRDQAATATLDLMFDRKTYAVPKK
jgi:hypothetical protein